MNKFEEALEHINDIGIVSSGSTQNDKRIKQTIEYALKLAVRLEQEPSKKMIKAAPNRNADNEKSIYQGIFKAMIEQLKKEVEDA